MRTLAIVLITFILAMVTSVLLSWSFILEHWVRQLLVITFILLELFFGYVSVASVFKLTTPKTL